MKKSIYSESEVVKAERTGMSRIRRRSGAGLRSDASLLV